MLYLSVPLSDGRRLMSVLFVTQLAFASDAGGIGGERAAAGLLPRCEGGSQTLPADHTGHTADGPGAEGHQANAGEDLLSAA